LTVESPPAAPPGTPRSKSRFPERPDEEIWPGGRLDPAALFGRRAPLEVEIGSGKARFLIESARANQSHDFLGLELSLSYYRICRQRVARAGLPNARVLRADARRFVESALAPASVRTFHVYFPDPWPKKRQRKRRLLDGVFLEILASRLERGGLVRIATDHSGYRDLIESVLETVRGLERRDWNFAAPPVPTHYELKYRAEGREIWKVLLVKTEGPPRVSS
jgi:tRNA (guanine-N7-)-methyltransferase